MVTTIHRKIELTSDDLKAAVMTLLREQSRQCPGDDDHAEFKLTPTGAELSWTTRFETDV